MIHYAVRGSGGSEWEVSGAATGQHTAIPTLKIGRTPSAERLRQLCATLGLEFYVGPSRPSPPVDLGFDPRNTNPTAAEKTSERLVALGSTLPRDQLSDTSPVTQDLARLVSGNGCDPILPRQSGTSCSWGRNNRWTDSAAWSGGRIRSGGNKGSASCRYFLGGPRADELRKEHAGNGRANPV